MASEKVAISKIVFGMFTSQEIQNLSVVEIKTSLCFNALDHPLKDGLYDLVMGPSGTATEACETCKQTVRNCCGHFGHINLPLPVVNPLFHKEVFTLLKMSCFACYKLVIQPDLRNLFIYQMKLLNHDKLAEAIDLETNISYDATELAQKDEANLLIKDKIMETFKDVDFNSNETSSSRTIESLRRQFTNEFLKKIVFPLKCPHCKKPLKKLGTFQNKITEFMSKEEVAEKYQEIVGEKSETVGKKSETKFVTPLESREKLRKIWIQSSDLIQELMPVLKNTDLEYPTDLFFMDVVLVTPPKTRPINFTKGKLIEDSHTSAYKNIVDDCIIIKTLVKAVEANSFELLPSENRIFVETIKGNTPLEKFHECWVHLQNNINNLLDCHMNQANSKTTVAGLKQVIEKKEGVLRMHMMGKRVNFAARSVITPDPNLGIQEIGVPEDFAKKLTYPTRVNFFNVEELRKMVVNGPDIYPGASLVENENGSLIKLFGGDENKKKREGVAKLLLKSIEIGGPSSYGRKKVHRHLLSGDVLLLNRQPTLHRPSIMAHKAKILKNEKTLRLHYSNCKAYNADFDGDEMNAHFPQTELSRSEAYNVVNVSNHYLVPKDGTPLGGLIQDHIVSAVRLTVRGQMFDREDYYQLVYQALAHKPGNIVLLPSCIVKPKKLWSGKQIISTLLMNIIPEGKNLISFSGTSKINNKSWEKEPSREWKCGIAFDKDKEMSESEVIIQKGYLISGVLDKQHFGATPYGLTHCLYELYGGDCSSNFLDSVGRLCTAYLQMNGFTLGVEDILVNAKADKSRRHFMRKLRKIGDEIALKALELDQKPDDLKEHLEKAYFDDPVKFKSRLDQEYKTALDSYTNEINKVCIPGGLIAKFPDNNLQLMVSSGAKGSSVNTMQISCLLGQIELEGKRPPLMISGKSLPSFKAFDTRPCAGGYIDSRFMTGITPQEFFFHCMAGREGLIDTAVKTSRSGYLQRCLIKHLEGISVCYDGTVRDHDGSVIQFAYGEDGIEVQKSTFFKKNLMNFLANNADAVVDRSVIKKLKKETPEEIKEYKKKMSSWKDYPVKKVSPFTVFTQRIRDDISEKSFKKFNKLTGRSKAYKKMLKKWNSLAEESKREYQIEVRPDPLSAKFNRNHDFGVISEKIEALIEEYITSNFEDKGNQEKKKLRNMMEAKYMLSLCEPGEAVGLLAAQSVGEPSTQMTLNTFHFAGRGEMNVTLGIPRLREILMTASKSIKTPYLDVPLKKVKSEKKKKKNAKKLKQAFQKVTLADVLEKIVVDEKLLLEKERLFTYTVRFQFLPHDCYKNDFVVKPKDIINYMEKRFLLTLSAKIRKFAKRYGDSIHETKEEKIMSKKSEEEDGEDVDNVDATGISSRNMNRLGEEHESSDEEEELDDDDATKAKLRSRHKENKEYDEPEESEEEKSEDESEGEKELEVEREKEQEELALTKEEMKDVENRTNYILSTFALIKSYKFDVAKEEWCEMVIGIPLSLSRIDFSTLLKSVCENSVLYEIPQVKRAIIYQKPDGEFSMKTEGINFQATFRFDKLIDLNRMYSNDVHKVIETYGIEAGVRVIVKELNDVFAVYGITVDPRHLLLIADYMTHQGCYSPFNRVGIADSPSPFHKMSFESSTGFLKKSLILRQEDNMDSPSSRIMAGKFCKSGTGSFDVMTLLSI